MEVTFFAPHAGIWVHAFPEALVAEALKQAGHRVTYLTCGGLLDSQCTVMSASRSGYADPPWKRERVCRQCNQSKQIIRERFHFAGEDLAAALTEEDRLRIADILDEVTPENFGRLELEGIPVGRYASYEFLLNRKKGDLRLDGDEWKEYAAWLKGALAVYFAGRRALDRHKPDCVVTYNSLYGVNRIFSRLAESRGIPTYFLHAGGNLSRRLQALMFGRGTTLRYLKNLIAGWPGFRDTPCPPGLMKQITDHFMVLFKGGSLFAYSSSTDGRMVDVRKVFGIGPEQRILMATMSSPDERFAARTVDALPDEGAPLFATQVEWIRALIAYVAGRPDLFLLIRVHPREFPNKRENVRSAHASLLVTEFSDLPGNVRVNWPNDGISLYQLANQADVFLNAWSSAGKEMALLGIPVVSYCRDLLFYPGDLNYLGETEEEYFRGIERALEEGWSIENSRRVFRWLAVEYGYGLIDIGDSYRQSEHPGRSPGAILRKAPRKLARTWFQMRDCSRRAIRLKEASRVAAILENGLQTPLESAPIGPVEADVGKETQALRHELRRIADALYPSDPAPNPGNLRQRLVEGRADAKRFP
jgi:hypothetical protein